MNYLHLIFNVTHCIQKNVVHCLETTVSIYGKKKNTEWSKINKNANMFHFIRLEGVYFLSPDGLFVYDGTV